MTPRPMYQLAYSSTATKSLHSYEILNLLTKSRENNKMRGITGMLLYRKGSFFQVLEGEEEAVHKLFKIIFQDPRHEKVRIVLDEDIAEREFPKWSMSFRDMDSPEGACIEGYDDYLSTPWDNEYFASKTRKFINLFKYLHDTEEPDL